MRPYFSYTKEEQDYIRSVIDKQQYMSNAIEGELIHTWIIDYGKDFFHSLALKRLSYEKLDIFKNILPDNINVNNILEKSIILRIGGDKKAFHNVNNKLLNRCYNPLVSFINPLNTKGKDFTMQSGFIWLRNVKLDCCETLEVYYKTAMPIPHGWIGKNL